jgi:hypothetical protein
MKDMRKTLDPSRTEVVELDIQNKSQSCHADSRHENQKESL